MGSFSCFPIISDSNSLQRLKILCEDGSIKLNLVYKIECYFLDVFPFGCFKQAEIVFARIQLRQEHYANNSATQKKPLSFER